MSKFKEFKEFRKQFGEWSIVEHLLLDAIGKDKDFDYENVKKNGLDLKIFINSKEYDFTNLMIKINNHFIKIENEAKTISNIEIEHLFKEKVSDKLYNILNKLEEVDNAIKSCVSYEENDITDYEIVRI